MKLTWMAGDGGTCRYTRLIQWWTFLTMHRRPTNQRKFDKMNPTTTRWRLLPGKLPYPTMHRPRCPTNQQESNKMYPTNPTTTSRRLLPGKLASFQRKRGKIWGWDMVHMRHGSGISYWRRKGSRIHVRWDEAQGRHCSQLEQWSRRVFKVGVSNKAKKNQQGKEESLRGNALWIGSAEERYERVDWKRMKGELKKLRTK